MVIGDSHAARLYPHRAIVADHLRQVEVRWDWRRGAGIEWAEQQVQQASGSQIVVLLVGGNDIDSGMSPLQLADRIGHLSQQLLDAGAKLVAIPSLWPRSSARYNAAARSYASLMERRFHGHPEISFWLWDRRQSWRNYDGVHFTRHGYRLALRYLVAIVVWLINHNLWW